MVTGELITPVR